MSAPTATSSSPGTTSHIITAVLACSHPSRRALRLGLAARGGPGDRARHRLCRPPGTLPARPPTAAGAPRGCVDQPPKPPAAEETRGLAATRGGVLDHAGPGPLLSAHRSDLDRRG